MREIEEIKETEEVEEKEEKVVDLIVTKREDRYFTTIYCLFLIGKKGSAAEVKNNSVHPIIHPTVAYSRRRKHIKDYVGESFSKAYRDLCQENIGLAEGSEIS